MRPHRVPGRDAEGCHRGSADEPEERPRRPAAPAPAVRAPVADERAVHGDDLGTRPRRTHPGTRRSAAGRCRGVGIPHGRLDGAALETPSPRRGRGRRPRGGTARTRGRRDAVGASPAGAVGARPRGRGDDGEPLVRPSPRLAARRGREAGRPHVRRRIRDAAPDVPARAGLPGVRVRRPRPFVRRRAHRVGQRRVRRLAEGERPVVDRLLPAAGPAVPRQGGAGVHDVRPLLRLVHGADVPEPVLLAVGADRPDRATSRRASTCRPSSTASPRSGSRPRTTTETSRSCSCTSGTSRSRSRTARSSSSAGPGSSPRSRTSTRTSRSTKAARRREARETTTTRTQTSARGSTSSRPSTTR